MTADGAETTQGEGVTLTEAEREALTEALMPPTRWGDYSVKVIDRLMDAAGAEFALETLAPAIERIIAARVAQGAEATRGEWTADQIRLIEERGAAEAYHNGLRDGRQASQTERDALRERVEAAYDQRVESIGSGGLRLEVVPAENLRLALDGTRR